ncbi:MAG: ADP-glyceromanno-heptose 6-epimerase [Verrucomicrobiota bacterium]
MKQILVTGGSGFIGSNLTLELQDQFPDAKMVVIDDFRSADFKNLEGFRGEVIAADMSLMNLGDRLGAAEWDAVFHLASITDTRELNTRLQVHDNVEAFHRLLSYLQAYQCPLVYASSAATYGIRGGVNKETDLPQPANAYAFSKAIMDNLARQQMKETPDWKIVGLKYFNVYGPREAHKGVPASMIFHLAHQMNDQKRPRIFKMGEQQRDFVYVKDIVRYTIGALNASESAILNAGSGQPRSFNDLVQVLNQVLGTDYEPEYIENPFPFYQPHTEADMSETKRVLNLEPQYSLEEGVKDYYDSGWLLKS